MGNFFVVVDAGTYSAEGSTFGPGRHACEDDNVRAAIEMDRLGHVRIEEGGKPISTAEVETATEEKFSGGPMTKDDLPKDPGGFVCETCNRSFTSAAGLTRHITVAHDPSKSVEPEPVEPPATVDENASAATAGPGGPIGEAGAPEGMKEEI